MSEDSKYRLSSPQMKLRRLKEYWFRFWMKLYRIGISSNLILKIAALFAPPHKSGIEFARLHDRGFISPSATIYHSDAWVGKNVYIAENVTLYQNKDGGKVEIGDKVCIYKGTILETGFGGSLRIDKEASIHPNCQVNAYKSPITIGKGVMIAPKCGLYSYDHGIAPGKPIRKQPLQSKGPIVIEDEAWLGFGSIVLSGVRIGKGAVVGAGSVVMKDIPENAIAVGNPAKVIKMRDDIKELIGANLDLE